MNSAGQCNVLYIVDLNRERIRVLKKLNESDQTSENHQNLLQSTHLNNSFISNFLMNENKEIENNTISNDYSSNNDGNNLLTNENFELLNKMFNDDQQNILNNDQSLNINLLENQNFPQSFQSQNDSHCFTDFDRCSDFISSNNYIFENINQNDLFFENNVYDIFNDIESQNEKNNTKNYLDFQNKDNP